MVDTSAESGRPNPFANDRGRLRCRSEDRATSFRHSSRLAHRTNRRLGRLSLVAVVRRSRPFAVHETKPAIELHHDFRAGIVFLAESSLASFV